MSVTVSVLAGQTRQAISPDAFTDPVVVPAQHLTIEIQGDSLPREVHLDGRGLPLVAAGQTRAFLSLPMFGSVGFHCLRIQDDEFFFATQDGKLKLEGILELLDFVAEHGLSWGGQLFFSDGSSIRHTKVDFAWLQRMGPRILELAGSIAERPFRRVRLECARSASGAGRLSLGETMRLLRRTAPASMEATPAGPILVGSRRYAPRTTVVGKARRSFDVVGNRRVTSVLQMSAELCTYLQSDKTLPQQSRAALQAMVVGLRQRLARFPFAQLRDRVAHLPERPSLEEMVDSRYQESYGIYEEMRRSLGWNPTARWVDRMAYVSASDQIYQAFVALAVARAFGTKQVMPALAPRLSGPLFRSETHDIYYDTRPPAPEFTNWRDGSARPTEQKPDLTIVDRVARRGVITDAKYRVESSGQPPTEALESAQVYLQMFERRKTAIFFPGPVPSVTRVEAKGYTILEIAVGPYPHLANYLASEVRPAIEDIMEPLGQ